MIATSVATPRFRFFFTTAFAVLAVLLAMVGVYGVMSYLTAQRTSEFGLRLALGAKPKDLLIQRPKTRGAFSTAGLIIGGPGLPSRRPPDRGHALRPETNRRGFLHASF